MDLHNREKFDLCSLKSFILKCLKNLKIVMINFQKYEKKLTFESIKFGLLLATVPLESER